jgi:hypothetical protein
MADVISRLKLDSGEFDSKIKRAGQELMAYSEHCKKMGLEMGYANKDAKDFAKALGSMQTTSSSARGKINELTEAFVNLKVMYKNMTDEEKNNAFGKNLAASLDQLKTRIDQAKAELNDVNKELGNTKQAEVDTKGGLEGLTSALGINIKTLAGWGTAIAAGKMALDVAKDAFFASESSVDEWGRTVEASQSLYEGFLTAINNGDISGYLSNIDSIVKAARLAYDELDKLGTMKTIQAPQISKQQTENERIRSMIQTGRYIAPQDGRKNAVFNGREMQAGDKLTAGQIRYLEKQLQGGMQKIVKLVGNEVDQTGKAINAYYDKLAKTNGMSLQEFKKGTSSWEEFTKRMQGYEQYKEWDKQARTEFAKQGGRGNVDFDKSNPYAEFRKWGTFRVDKEGENSYKDLVNLIQQRDQQVGQVYSTQAQAYRTMNRAEGVTVRQIMGGTGGKGGKGGTTDKNLDDEQKVQQKINDLLKEALTADANRQGEIRQQVAELQKQQEKYKDIKNLAQGILPKDKEAVFTIDGQLSEETKKNLREIENVTIDDKTMTVTANTQEAMQKVQDLIGQVSTTTLQMKVKTDGAPTFTMAQLEGMSFDNQIPTTRGNRGKAQDKLDLATAAFATSGTSNVDFSNYISGIKNALSNANLGDELYTSMTEKLKDATTVSTLLQEMMERGLAGADLESTAQALKEKMLSPEGIDQTAIQSFLEELNKQIEEAGGVGLKLNADTGEVSDKDKDDGKELKKFNEGIGKLTGGLSQVTGGLKAIGIELPQEVDQVLGVINGVSQIISGVGTIISIFGTTALTANTTAVGLNTAAVTGLIAAVEFNSATNFFGLANGGIVPAFAQGGLIGRAAAGMMIPGNSMSGDRLRLPVDGGRGMIGVNSGELILNKSSQNSLAASLLNAEALVDSIRDYRVSLGNAQQGMIAGALEGGGIGNLHLETVISGEDIRVVLKNNGRRTGRGEYITSRNSRS